LNEHSDYSSIVRPVKRSFVSLRERKPLVDKKSAIFNNTEGRRESSE